MPSKFALNIGSSVSDRNFVREYIIVEEVNPYVLGSMTHVMHVLLHSCIP